MGTGVCYIFGAFTFFNCLPILEAYQMLSQAHQMLSEAYQMLSGECQMLSESSRLSFQIFSQSLTTKLKVLYNQKSSEQYQHPSELANNNHQRRFQI